MHTYSCCIDLCLAIVWFRPPRLNKTSFSLQQVSIQLRSIAHQLTMKWWYYQITAIILLLIHNTKFVSSKVIIEPQIGYDKTSKPNKTVEILVSFNIETISVINLYKQTIQLSLEVIVEWEETRVNIIEEEDAKVLLPQFFKKKL